MTRARRQRGGEEQRAGAVATATRPAVATGVRGLQPGRPLSTDDVSELQRTAGNAAVGELLTGNRATVQRDPEKPPTPASIGAALDQVTSVSSTVTKVRSLRPWVIFETLPWNPIDGRKKTLYQSLKKAHGTLRKAEKTLADAKARAATAPAAPAPTTAPAGKRRKKAKPAKAAKALPTVDEAQAAVDKARTTVESRTTELKEYVKGKLDSSKNPKLAGVRTQKSQAAADLKKAVAALKAAKGRKHPDSTLIADLTKQRDAAQQRVDAAAAAVGTRLAALRSEIDAADWGQQDVDQTKSVYDVDGARATLVDRVDAYATVAAGGFEGSAERTGTGGPTVPELLGKDPTIGPSARKILAIISRHEGSFSTINTWDIADVTFGMVQWTTGAGGNGDLIHALTIMKQAAPEAFARRLVRYGINVAPTGLVLTQRDGTVLTGVPAAKAVQSDPKLAAVLASAGTDPSLQAAELRAANEIEVKAALASKLQIRFPGKDGAKATTVGIPISSVLTSEFAVGVLANNTVHGGLPAGDLRKALNAFVASHKVLAKDVATWAPDCESDLVKSMSKGADADRIAEMRKELDHSPDSFR